MGGNILKSNSDNILDRKIAISIDDENKLYDEDAALSSVEPLFFGDEKVIERIVRGDLNTVPLGDLIK